MALNKLFQSSDNSFPSNILRVAPTSPGKRSVFLRNVSKLPPDYTLSHPRRQKSSQLGLRFSGFQDNSHHNLDCSPPVSNTTAVFVLTCSLKMETRRSFQKSIPSPRLHVVMNQNTAPLTVSSSHTGLHRTLVSTKLHALPFAHVVY